MGKRVSATPTPESMVWQGVAITPENRCLTTPAPKGVAGVVGQASPVRREVGQKKGSSMTDTIDFTIRTLSVINGQANNAGNRLLASFNMEIAGLYLSGCVLILKADGTVTAAGPAGKSRNNVPINTRIADPELNREVTRRACEIYKLFTGQRAEAV